MAHIEIMRMKDEIKAKRDEQGHCTMADQEVRS